MELKIETNSLGAELISAKLDGVEKIHQGNKIVNREGEVYWKKQAPILFPIIGNLKNGKTVINGKEYEIPPNGFAENMEFELLKKEDTQHVYRFISNKETQRMFPFAFVLYVTYTIVGETLSVEYKVENKDKKTISFGIGGFPAFICDIATGCYEIEFQEEENEAKILHLERGLVSHTNEYVNKNIIKDGKNISLNSETFSHDAIIINNLHSHAVFLRHHEKTQEIMKLDFTGFDTLAIWSKKDAPFICIGPWNSIPDMSDSDGQFSSKIGNIQLEKEATYCGCYQITFK